MNDMARAIEQRRQELGMDITALIAIDFAKRQKIDIPAFGGPGMYGHRVHEAVLAAGETVSGATVPRAARSSPPVWRSPSSLDAAASP